MTWLPKGKSPIKPSRIILLITKFKHCCKMISRTLAWDWHRPINIQLNMSKWVYNPHLSYGKLRALLLAQIAFDVKQRWSKKAKDVKWFIAINIPDISQHCSFVNHRIISSNSREIVKSGARAVRRGKFHNFVVCLIAHLVFSVK